MGERAIRFSPNGGTDYVDVCPLCAETALEYGWIREGSPTTPTVPDERRRRGRGLLATLLGTTPRQSRRRSRPSRSCAGSPRRSSRSSRPPISSTPRSTGARSAGSGSRSASPRVSVVAALGRERRGGRDGRLGHLLVPVPRLARLGATRCGSKSRGHDPGELEATFTEWNAHMDGRRPHRPRHRAGVTASRTALASAGSVRTLRAVIYCVIPRELEAELFERMVEYYQRQPERDGDRRPPRRARPARPRETRRARGAAPDARPPPPARPGTFLEDRRPSSRSGGRPTPARLRSRRAWRPQPSNR